MRRAAERSRPPAHEASNKVDLLELEEIDLGYRLVVAGQATTDACGHARARGRTGHDSGHGVAFSLQNHI